VFEESDVTVSIVQEFGFIGRDMSNSKKMAALPFRDTYLSTYLKGGFVVMFLSEKVHFVKDMGKKVDEAVKAIADGTVFLAA